MGVPVNPDYCLNNLISASDLRIYLSYTWLKKEREKGNKS